MRSACSAIGRRLCHRLWVKYGAACVPRISGLCWTPLMRLLVQLPIVWRVEAGRELGAADSHRRAPVICIPNWDRKPIITLEMGPRICN